MNPLTTLRLLESTFPGWPEYTPVSNMHMFLLTLGIPLLVGLVVTGLMIGTHRRQDLRASNEAAGMVDPQPRTTVESGRTHAAVESGQNGLADAARTGSHAADSHH